VSPVRGNLKGLQAKSSPEYSEPVVAEMLGDSPDKRGNLWEITYLAGKQEREMTCKTHRRD